MKIDFQNKPYNCPRYGQIVTVRIKRHHCDRPSEVCPEPQPHIVAREFDGCTDILNCGIGKTEGGVFYAPLGMQECPAWQTLTDGSDL